jgi:hypothetical protein
VRAAFYTAAVSKPVNMDEQVNRLAQKIHDGVTQKAATHRICEKLNILHVAENH